MTGIEISWRRYLLPPLHEEGPKFLAIFALGTLLLALVWLPLGLIGLAASVWCFFFFRDPPRTVPTRDGLVVSPASGVVQMLGEMVPPAELGLGEAPRQRVSVFMSVFDCHVNRVPAGGTVEKVLYKPGKFVNATLDKASEDNERNSVVVRLADGRQIAFVQIAGLVARRIRCDAREGQSMRTGERFGLIRFGSRLDIYLPEGVNPLVGLGQVAVSGETVIADLAGSEPPRPSEIL